MRHSNLTTGAAVIVLGLTASAAFPIIMRHDVAEERFLELATKYSPVASVRPADPKRGLGAEGTLIDPHWVLTAAHVAVRLGPGDVVEVSGDSVPIDRVVLHPEWKGVTDARRDVALVRVKTPLRHVPPAELYSASDEAGLAIVFVGRGGTGTGLTGPTGEEDRRIRAATNRVDRADGPYLEFRFDAPADSAATSLEGISGPGDSGGPAFLERGGKLFVLGVSSWQDSRPAGKLQGRYGVLEYYCRVSFFYDWIQRTLKESPPEGRPG